MSGRVRWWLYKHDVRRWCSEHDRVHWPWTHRHCADVNRAYGAKSARQLGIIPDGEPW